MELGDGKSWIALLFGLLFCAVCLPLAASSALGLVQGLWRSLVALLRPKGRKGRASNRELREHLQMLLFTGMGSALALFLSFIGLVGQLPIVATWHPVLTSTIALLADERRVSSEMARGVAEGDLGLIRLCLALGADPRNAGSAQSWLNLTHSNEARQFLLQQGASPDGLAHQRHPLRAAWESADLAGFNWLLAQAADPARHEPADALDLIEALALAEGDQSQAYFDALLAAPTSSACADPASRGGADGSACWLQRRAASGESVLDRLHLAGLRPDWQQRLRAAGAVHGLLLDRGTSLPADHPALRHVQAWLAARSVDPDWSRDDRDWTLPQADHTGIPEYLPVPPLQLSGRGLDGETLVRVSGLSRGGVEVVYQIRLVPLRAELGDGLDDQLPWRIAGYWQEAGLPE